ncbi:MAG: four-carbon acid sugar kinase family protein [Thermomicrobiales bacterium]
MRRTTSPSGLVGIVADDITGACDAAAQFQRAGARTAVILDDGDDALPKEWDVIAVTTEARRTLPTIAAARTRAAVERLRDAGAERLYIKIDSTLRGAPGGIVEAAAMAFGVPYALVAPAFPEQGRTVLGGWVRRDDTAIMDGMARLAETAIASIGHIPLRAIRSSMTAIAISPGLLVDSVALLLADAERDDDLWTLAEYAASTELSLVAGSAGLARYIAPFWCWETTNADDDETWAERDGPVLVAVGTRNPMTQAQLTYLREADDICVVDVMQDDVDAALPAIRRALDRNPVVVVALAVPQTVAVANAGLDGLARIVVEAAVERGDDLRGLVTTGGATTLAICTAAGAHLLRLVDEVLPGVPCSVMTDGQLVDVPTITKSGGFVQPDALAVACVWLMSDAADDLDAMEWDDDEDDEPDDEKE